MMTTAPRIRTRADWLAVGAVGAADLLRLAAAPTFALMALLAAIFAGGSADMFCSAMPHSPFGGMVFMYMLMSAFHLAPWLKLIAGSDARLS